VDLNLYRVFAAIYRTQNLTRAAEQLHLSQSAVSHALARLRQQLGDPLFVRDQQRMRPTPQAQQLWPQLEQGLQLLEQLAQPVQGFDPGRDAPQLTVALHDALEGLLLPDWYARLKQDAPQLQLHSVRLDRDHLLQALRTGRVDLAVDVAQPAPPELRHACCLTDDWVLVHSAGVQLRSADDYLQRPHVVVSARRTGRSLEDLQLARQGLNRTVVLRCQDYQTALAILARPCAAAASLVLTAPRQIISRLPLPATLCLSPLPIALEPVALHVYWHQSREQEARLQWARGLLPRLS
jgi:DNA-binding transcriptional LysR family regulator